MHFMFQCTGTCANGWQRRQVDCKTYEGRQSDKCDADSRPVNARRCDIPCEEQLLTQEGKECTVKPRKASLIRIRKLIFFFKRTTCNRAPYKSRLLVKTNWFSMKT